MPYTIQYWQWQYHGKANTHPACHVLTAALGAATHPGLGGGTHRRRATFEHGYVFVRGVRLGVWGVVLVVCVCVGVWGVVLCRCVCVTC